MVINHNFVPPQCGLGLWLHKIYYFNASLLKVVFVQMHIIPLNCSGVRKSSLVVCKYAKVTTAGVNK